MQVEWVVDRLGRSVVLPPDRQGGEPGVYLEAVWTLMRFVDQILQRIESRGQVWVFGARLEAPRIVGVTAPSDFDEQGIEIGAACPGDQVINLFSGLEAVVEGVHPDRAQLGRIERLGGRAKGRLNTGHRRRWRGSLNSQLRRRDNGHLS